MIFDSKKPTSAIHAGFFRWEGFQNVWESVFGGLGQILLLARPRTLGIFQKFAWELLKIWKIMEKISENFKIFMKFSFFARAMGKIRIIIYVRYNWEGSSASPRSYKIFNNFIKKLNLLNLSNFRKFRKSFLQICLKTIK